MAGGQRSYTFEDTHNIPTLMRNLGVQNNDKDKESMRNGIRCCLSHGADQPVNKMFRYLHQRKTTFGRCHEINGVSSKDLAEAGFFMGSNGHLTCYQCGHWLHLQMGDDPFISHSDLFPNCQHIRRLNGKRPRPISVLGNLPQRQMTPGGARKRLFSE